MDGRKLEIDWLESILPPDWGWVKIGLEAVHSVII